MWRAVILAKYKAFRALVRKSLEAYPLEERYFLVLVMAMNLTAVLVMPHVVVRPGEVFQGSRLVSHSKYVASLGPALAAFWVSSPVMLESSLRVLNCVLRLPWMWMFLSFYKMAVAGFYEVLQNHENHNAAYAFTIKFVYSMLLIIQLYIAFELVFSKLLLDILFVTIDCTLALYGWAQSLRQKLAP